MWKPQFNVMLTRAAQGLLTRSEYRDATRLLNWGGWLLCPYDCTEQEHTEGICDDEWRYRDSLPAL